MRWRLNDWPADHYSAVTITFQSPSDGPKGRNHWANHCHQSFEPLPRNLSSRKIETWCLDCPGTLAPNGGWERVPEQVAKFIPRDILRLYKIFV